MAKKTVQDIEVSGKRVLVRADLNVPLAEGRVADDTRVRATLPTIRYLLEHDAIPILCSHLGRPKGKVVAGLRMDPVAERLSELLDRPVTKLDDCVGIACPGRFEAVAKHFLPARQAARFQQAAHDGDIHHG